MRYLSSASNPLAHYWEEDLTGIWGTWLRFRNRSRRAAGHLLGELIFANIFLGWTLLTSNLFVSSFSIRIEAVRADVNIGAFAKRIIDITGALIGLIISLPLWILVPPMIKLESAGPVLYTQERVGLNRRRKDRRQLSVGNQERRGRDDRREIAAYGKPFRIVKFRTMRPDAEKSSGPVWATKDDPRVTRIGRILRKTRIDEIPQLINVLKGDMSLVGPRPERPYFVEKLDGIIKDYRKRFDVKPGVTGLAQVEHKYDECLEDVNGKIRYDLNYIGNRGVIQDIKIMLKTMVVVLTARGM